MENVHKLSSLNICDVSAKTDNLIPTQQLSARKLLRKADCYQQKFIKFPHIGIFHSYAELLHAALLESDNEVKSFVPQPFLFRIGKRRYPPDCYYVKNGERFIIELKPGGELPDDTRIPKEKFCALENITFKVISNESILDREQLALNWLKIIRTLNSAIDIDSHDQELQIMDTLFEVNECELEDIVCKGDRLGQSTVEVGLFRLAHKGFIKLELEKVRLGYSTVVRLCS
ncbi:hypothetical protein [Aliikangiella sp. IMCC44359]|uniref:hypothetical protein n=1 Tax=Aliikangiella sp. IMCC44359 TaxID=3459125 RepID=UPI00403A9EEA